MAREVYHEGERAVQERAGVRAMAERIGRGITDAISPGVAAFLAQRYTAYLASIDGVGRPWASQLVGPPGFVRALDDRTVRLAAAPPETESVRAHLRENPALGLLAIDLATRRRTRLNGTGTIADGGAIELHVEQAFANCPKYIQRREPLEVDPEADSPSSETYRELPARCRDVIAAADTFFIATAHPEVGADISHRGGRPGFVEVVDERTLRWPDYAGNTMFQTLGNLTVDAHTGLLFVEWDGLATMQLTGRASIDWDPARIAAVPGAERLVEFALDEVRWHPSGNPIRWRLVDASPHNP
jgi:predicted pyridoxine 5'-phosphate oxidase superfamily flavin-nucleotide-binding protein